MPDVYYVNVRSGETFANETIHADKACARRADGPNPRPIRAEVLAANAPECPECIPQADDKDTDDAPSGTCEVVKSDGEVCGRSRPCRYHD